MKEIGGSRVYLNWKEWEEGDFVEGKWVDEYTDSFGNPAYVLQLADYSLSNAPETIEKGGSFVLNSCGSLKAKMEKLQVGAKIRVEYAGVDKIKKGKFTGKEFHNVRVFLTEEDGDEVNNAQASEKDPFAGL